MSGLKQLSELKRLEVRFDELVVGSLRQKRLFTLALSALIVGGTERRGAEHMFTRSAGCSTLILESPLVIMKTSLK